MMLSVVEPEWVRKPSTVQMYGCICMANSCAMPIAVLGQIALSLAHCQSDT